MIDKNSQNLERIDFNLKVIKSGIIYPNNQYEVAFYFPTVHGYKKQYSLYLHMPSLYFVLSTHLLRKTWTLLRLGLTELNQSNVAISMCCDMDQSDTIGKIELFPSIVLSTRVTN